MLRRTFRICTTRLEHYYKTERQDAQANETYSTFAPFVLDMAVPQNLRDQLVLTCTALYGFLAILNMACIRRSLITP